MDIGAYLGPIISIYIFYSLFGKEIKDIARSLKRIADATEKKNEDDGE